MNEAVVRVQQIELHNFKNVKYGVVDLPSYIDKKHFSSKADVLGLYGQNGSGKTALVEAFQLLQRILQGEPLPANVADYILFGAESTTLNYTFSINVEREKFLVYYEVCIKKADESALVSEEILQLAPITDDAKMSKKTMIQYQYSSDAVFTPKLRYEEILKADKKNNIELEVVRKLSIRNKTSFIFGAEGYDLFTKGFSKKSKVCSKILEALKVFAFENLFVIGNRNSGAINLNVVQPFVFKLGINESITKGTIGIALEKPCLIEEEVFDIADKLIKQMNIVLSKIIPGLTVELKNYGKQSMDNGDSGVKVELMSIRGDVRIPLRCESDGIKKIISLLNSIIQMYNHENICIVVDELDAGVFEYLLGEILSTLEMAGKGQFIFTSHNLRALEKLNKHSVLFTTVNPQNRYIRFTNVKSSNNLRDLYIRSINLGGQKEALYEETDTYEIRRAFRLAGKE